MLRLCTILTGMHGSHSISGWDNVNTVTGRDEKFGPREVGQILSFVRGDGIITAKLCRSCTPFH